jgi:hypothetical protein
MTTRHRIAAAVFVSLGLAMSATPALAWESNLTPNGSEVPASRPSVTSQTGLPATPPTVVRVVAGNGGFDWGDAGIGAGGGFALSMIVVGGALVATQRRSRRTRGNVMTG